MMLRIPFSHRECPSATATPFQRPIIVTSTTEGAFMSDCLSVCMEDISKRCEQNRMNFCGQFGCATRTKCWDFGEDINPDPRVFQVMLHHWEMEPKTIHSISRYLKKLWTDLDETWWTRWVHDKDKFIQCWWRSESDSRKGWNTEHSRTIVQVDPTLQGRSHHATGLDGISLRVLNTCSAAFHSNIWPRSSSICLEMWWHHYITEK